MTLARRHALVSGGGSGIGRAVAHRLAGVGAAVTVLDVDGAKASAVAAELSDAWVAAHAVAADVADGAAVGAAVESARAGLGAIHITVCSAGIAGFSPLLDLGEAEWDRMLGVHLRGTYLVTRAVLGDMV